MYVNIKRKNKSICKYIYIYYAKKEWWQSGSTEAYWVAALCARSLLCHAVVAKKHTRKTVLRVYKYI